MTMGSQERIPASPVARGGGTRSRLATRPVSKKRKSRAPHDGHGETAAHHLVEAVPLAQPADTVAHVLAHLKASPDTEGNALYLVDDEQRLVGVASLGNLLRQRPDSSLEAFMLAPPPTVSLGTDQEQVANVALRHHLTAVPVADTAGRFLGVVPTHALMQILRHEHVEDLHRMAGIRHDTAEARLALEASPIRRVRDRLPWLLVGLGGSILATALVAGFEGTLQAQVAVAFFMPGLVYLTDAIGTQTEAIMIRGLSTTHQSGRKLLWGELRTGLLLGTILGALVFAAVLVAYRNARLAMAVAVTVTTAGFIACTVGVGLPWLLRRLGKDPAFGCGPLATIIQDVLTLVIYFLMVRWLM